MGRGMLLFMAGILWPIAITTINYEEFAAVCWIHFQTLERVSECTHRDVKIPILYRAWHSIDCCHEDHQSKFIHLYIRMYGLRMWLDNVQRALLLSDARSLYMKLRNIYNSYWYLDQRWMELESDDSANTSTGMSCVWSPDRGWPVD